MRTTGASDAQIEAAAISEWGKSSLADPNTIKVVTKYARMLVRADQRIIDEQDLRALVQSVDRGRMPWSVTEAIDRITALLDGETS